METTKISKEIKVLYVKADSFPAGITDAWVKLHSKLPELKGRHFYGISHGDNKGGIVYMAAVEESFNGEAEKLGCKTFNIPTGNYISETLPDWKQDVMKIGTTFQKLLKDPSIDPMGFCLEVYPEDGSVNCLVKLK